LAKIQLGYRISMPFDAHYSFTAEMPVLYQGEIGSIKSMLLMQTNELHKTC
jgi:hypothetical protein